MAIRKNETFEPVTMAISGLTAAATCSCTGWHARRRHTKRSFADETYKTDPTLGSSARAGFCGICSVTHCRLADGGERRGPDAGGNRCPR
jgi:hypothetical protein